VLGQTSTDHAALVGTRTACQTSTDQLMMYALLRVLTGLQQAGVPSTAEVPPKTAADPKP
jgi:hypothetical protein